jgi:phage regulator Rha-like protein
MTTFEQTLLREVATLPESRQADVLAFVRFLKISLPNEEKVRDDFKDALEDARATAKEYNITQEDIDAEICSMRGDSGSE